MVYGRVLPAPPRSVLLPTLLFLLLGRTDGGGEQVHWRLCARARHLPEEGGGSVGDSVWDERIERTDGRKVFKVLLSQFSLSLGGLYNFKVKECICLALPFMVIAKKI